MCNSTWLIYATGWFTLTRIDYINKKNPLVVFYIITVPSFLGYIKAVTYKNNTNTIYHIYIKYKIFNF